MSTSTATITIPAADLRAGDTIRLGRAGRAAVISSVRHEAASGTVGYLVPGEGWRSSFAHAVVSVGR